VGGHRRFRPSVLARALRAYDVVNVGAAGTFVVRKPGSRAAFRTALLRKLPFETAVVLCTGRELLRLAAEHPFGAQPSRPDVVRFVSFLPKRTRGLASLPSPSRRGESGSCAWSRRTVSSFSASTGVT